MAVEPLLRGGLRQINRTYQYTSFDEWQIRLCEQRHTLKMPLTPREILNFPR